MAYKTNTEIQIEKLYLLFLRSSYSLAPIHVLLQKPPVLVLCQISEKLSISNYYIKNRIATSNYYIKTKTKIKLILQLLNTTTAHFTTHHTYAEKKYNTTIELYNMKEKHRM